MTRQGETTREKACENECTDFCCFSITYHEQEEVASAKFSLVDPGIVHKGYRYQPVEPVMLQKVGPFFLLFTPGMIKKTCNLPVSKHFNNFQQTALKFLQSL